MKRWGGRGGALGLPNRPSGFSPMFAAFQYVLVVKMRVKPCSSGAAVVKHSWFSVLLLPCRSSTQQQSSTGSTSSSSVKLGISGDLLTALITVRSEGIIQVGRPRCGSFSGKRGCVSTWPPSAWQPRPCDTSRLARSRSAALLRPLRSSCQPVRKPKR